MIRILVFFLLLTCFPKGMISQLEAFFELAHDNHGHHQTAYKYVNEAANLCRASYEQPHFWNYARKLGEDIKDYHIEEEPEYIDPTFYSRKFNFDDKGYHYWVLLNLDWIQEEGDNFFVHWFDVDADDYIYAYKVAAYQGPYVIPEMYRLSSTVRLNTLNNNVPFEEFWIYQCSVNAWISILQVYRVEWALPANFPVDELQDPKVPPWNNTQWMYGNLFSYSLKNHMGNLNLTYNRIAHIDCVDKWVTPAIYGYFLNIYKDYKPKD